MPRFLAPLRSRRAAAVFAAGVIAIQAFFAGLTIAQGVLVSAGGPSDFAVICHGSGGADQGNGTGPDPTGAKHPCCMSCTSSVPGLAAPASASLSLPGIGFKSPVPRTHAVRIAQRAVRAGLSQGPPSQL
jgi:hypothetical protein